MSLTSIKTRARHFILTVNNETDPVAFGDQVRAAGVKDAQWQLEQGKEGTLHIQAYIGYKEAKSFLSVKKAFPRAHIEICKDPLKAWEYCGKVESRAFPAQPPLQHGNPPPARRNNKGDLKARNEMILAKGVVQAVNDGDIPLRDAVKFHQAICLHQALTQDVKQLATPDLHEVNCWYWGPPRTGKTNAAWALVDDPREIYVKNANKWWDGYDANRHKVVVIDDLHPGDKHMLSHLKRWATHKPFNAELKGGTMLIRPARIAVTSNYHPTDFNWNQVDCEAILARFATFKIEK